MENEHRYKDIRSFQRGEEKGFAAIFTEYYPALCYYAIRYVKDKAATGDIVQECFIKLWQRRENFNNLEQIRAYLYKIVRFGCIDHLKKESKDAAISIEEETEEPVLHHIIRTETWRQLYGLVETLPPAVARVIKMLYIEGKSIRETADELHKSVYTIKSQRARGIALLRSRNTGFLLTVFVFLCRYFTMIKLT